MFTKEYKEKNKNGVKTGILNKNNNKFYLYKCKKYRVL